MADQFQAHVSAIEGHSVWISEDERGEHWSVTLEPDAGVHPFTMHFDAKPPYELGDAVLVDITKATKLTPVA